MTHTRRASTYADVMKMPVEYRGENGAGQHLAANGGPLITDTFDTIEELVDRFGRRIVLHEKQLAHSGPRAAGETDAKAKKPYKPEVGGTALTRSQDRQEYAIGYIAGLLAK